MRAGRQRRSWQGQNRLNWRYFIPALTLDEANEYIEELESKLDSIAGIASGEEEQDDEGEETEKD